MEIKLNEQEAKELIKDYFKDTQKMEVEVTFGKDWKYVGNFREDESRYPQVSVNISGETELLGKKRKFTEVLSKEQVQTILEYCLEKTGLVYKRYSWDCVETARNDSFNIKGLILTIEKELVKPKKR